MAINVTYNDEINFEYIVLANGGGLVFNYRDVAGSGWDYFDDNAVVNDALYFSAGYGLDHADIKLNVGTAIAADAITLAWEYWATDSTWKTLAVTDNTNGFTVLGENWVTFTPPSDWDHATGSGAPLATSTYCWIRCRISAVTNITEGGAQAAAVVKMKNRKIIVSGGVSGTEADFEDIYDADQLAGWNVFLKHGQDGVIYESLRKIEVGGYFLDTAKIIIFADGIHHNDWGNTFRIYSSGVVNFGTLVSEARKTSQDGCFFYFKENLYAHNGLRCDTSGVLNLYSCGFMAYTINRANLQGFNRLWNCMGTKSGLRTVKAASDVSNMIQCGTSEAFATANPLSVDTFLAVETPIAGPPVNAESFVKNSKCRRDGYDVSSWAATASQKLRLINPDILWDEFNISWGGSPTGGEVWRGYELFLKVIDKDNNALTDTTKWWEISGATVLEHRETTAPYTLADCVAAGNWTVTFKTDTTALTSKYGFDSQSGRLILGFVNTVNGVHVDGTYYARDWIQTGVHTYSATYDGSTIQLYRDGVAVGASITDVVPIGGTTYWASRYDGSSQAWDNSFERCCVHSAQLTANEITTLHNQMNDRMNVEIKDKNGTELLKQYISDDGYINEDFGTATSGTTTTVTDDKHNWASNEWKGYDILITSGVGVGQKATISGNTANVLTFATMILAPDNTSKYIIVPILYHSYWDYTDGTNPQATYNPFDIEIRKAGFKTYKSDMTIEDKTLGSILLDKVLNSNLSKRARINM